MKKLILIFLIIYSKLFAQTPSTLVGSAAVWTDSLKSGRTSRIITMDIYYHNVDFASINNSSIITDSVKVESGTISYKQNATHTRVDTVWSSIDLRIGGSIISSMLILNTGEKKEYSVKSRNIQMLKFTLLNANTNAKFYFRVRANKEN